MNSHSGQDEQQRCQLQWPESELSRILLAQDLVPMVYEYICDFIEARGPDIETGGMLTGEFASLNGDDVFKLRGFIGAGPRAECSSESVLFDTDYQARMLELTRRRYPGVGNMGCIHLHPKRMDVCSENDWLADVAAVRASDTRVLVFAIVTVNNPRPDPLSLFYRNLKFDFFVLGERTGFEYRHIRPVLGPVPVVQAPAALGGFSGLLNAAARHSRHYASCPRILNDKKRLVAEVRAMEERYGGRAVLRLERNRLYWEYTVVESGRRFPIQVCYPRRYPLEPPRIFSVLELPTSPHQMPNNELCWTNRLGPGQWNPARDTAATCIHAAHRWFACLLVYLTLGRWPAEADDDFRYPTL